MKIVVNVHLKQEVLDPQGKAVLGALKRQGIEDVVNVRQGKQFILSFENEPNPLLLEKVAFLAKNLLSNPVIEDYSIEVKNDS